MVDHLLAPLLALVAPPRCLLCAAAGDAPLCASCAAALPWNEPACPGCAEPQPLAALCSACRRRPRAFDAAWSAFLQQTPVRETIHGLKYQARFAQSRWLAAQMAERLRQRTAPLPALLIPVPLHRLRLWQRGYNQALVLAQTLGRTLGIEVDTGAVRRRRATADQIGLSAAQRRRNLRGAFVATRSLRGLHVALVDDVMTTGATLDALARACRRAGAARIEVWTAARAA